MKLFHCKACEELKSQVLFLRSQLEKEQEENLVLASQIKELFDKIIELNTPSGHETSSPITGVRTWNQVVAERRKKRKTELVEEDTSEIPSVSTYEQ